MAFEPLGHPETHTFFSAVVSTEAYPKTVYGVLPSWFTGLGRGS